jgi:hypothetical protein
MIVSTAAMIAGMTATPSHGLVRQLFGKIDSLGTECFNQKLNWGDLIMNKYSALALMIGTLSLFTSPASAATTKWMSTKEFNTYSDTSLAQRWYPVTIECRAGAWGPQFRFTTATFTAANKPFHKWNYVHGKATQINRLIANLRLSDKPELKYRLIHSTSYVGNDRATYACAIAYR